MSAFGDGDPRTEIYDLLRSIREDHDLRGSRVVAMALEAISMFAAELADARDNSAQQST